MNAAKKSLDEFRAEFLPLLDEYQNTTPERRKMIGPSLAKALAFTMSDAFRRLHRLGSKKKRD